MQPKTAKTIIHGSITREKLTSGARQVYEAVKSTYGPAGNNVLYANQLDEPILTRDGVTVAKQIDLSDPVEDMGAQLIISASSQTNKQAGDGTSVTAIFTYHLIEKANKLIAAGHNPMVVRTHLQESSRKVLAWLEKQKHEIGENELEQVATVSCGDAEIGKLIAETIKAVGKSGGITVEKSNTRGVNVDVVSGFFFDSGFPTTAAIERAFDNVGILALDKTISSVADILPILKFVNASDSKKVLIVGELSGDAFNNFVANIQNAAYDGALVKAIGYGTERTEFLEDLALVTGGKVLRAGSVVTDQNVGEYFGSAKRVVVNERNTTIIDADGSEEDIEIKEKELVESLEKVSDEYRKDLTSKRINRLSGKIALIRVGGDSEVEADELKFRVDDAVQATKAAWEEGILPGGGATLLRASGIKDIHQIYREALQEPFLELMRNANERSEYRLEQVLRAPETYGFNLRDMTDEPVALIEAGVIDPYKVVRLAVANATSVASNLITTNCIIHKEVKDDSSNTATTNS